MIGGIVLLADGGVVMPVIAQTSYNRWVVVVSSMLMFVCATVGGVSRMVLERIGPEFKTQLLPDPPVEYATLGVIALLFLLGMMANAGLVTNSLERQRGKLSLVAVIFIGLLLLWIAGAFGLRVLGVLMHLGGGVSGGGEGE